MAYLGLTVRQGDTLGLVLDYDAATKEYTVDFEDGRLAKTARVYLVPDIDADPEVAIYRKSNRNERLAYTDQGWDVLSYDDDLMQEQDGGHTLIQRTDPNDMGNRQLDPSWGLGPDAVNTFVPANPDQEDSQDDTQPFFSVTPKPPLNQDEQFPSMMAATLDRCPECDDVMTDNQNHTEAACHACGHRQPIDYIARQARHKQSIPIAPIVEAIAGGGEEMAGGSSALIHGGGSILNVADDVMGSAAQAVKNAMGGQGDGEGSNPTGADKDMENFHNAADHIETGGKDNDGRDSDPFNSDTNSFEGLDGPETGKDVGGAGGSDDAGNAHGPDPITAFQALKPLIESGQVDTTILKALDKSLKEHHPDDYKGHFSRHTVISIDSMPGADQTHKECAVCHQDPSLISSCPMNIQGKGCPIFQTGSSDQSDNPGQPGIMNTPAPTFSHVTAHEQYMERVAARKPKMCPFHSDLVDYSLELGDPAAATSALSRHMYSPSSCKGGWAGDDPRRPAKCRFKPQMIKQEYWDQKEAEAEARRLEREQGQQPQQVDPNAITPEVPEDQPSAVADEPEGDTGFQALDEDSHMVVQDVPDTAPLQEPTDYVPEAPGMDNVTTLPQSAPAMPIAARVAQATDLTGEPLARGSIYEMKSSRQDDIQPDLVRITNVTPTNVQFVILRNVGSGTNPENKITIQDSLSTDQIASDGITFQPHVENPNAHGLPVESRTAGYNFSPAQQRDFVGEAGVARNLHKLDLSGTHYQEEASDSNDFVIGW